jgi:anti-anti-sigma factor
MEIKEEIYGDILVERVLFERATLMEAELLKDHLANKISAGFKKIIIDLSECEFIDSTFLGVIVNSLKKVAKANGDLKLVGFRPAVKAMFELTRMFRVFESFSNLNDAIDSFK